MCANETTLFCFPCAGASASPYLRWRKYAPAWLRLEPVELPGRGQRTLEPLIKDYRSLVDLASRELSTILPDDYAFFGHSFGAYIAFGVAHKFRIQNIPIPKSMLIACCAGPSTWNVACTASLNNDAAILDELRVVDGMPAEIFEHPELLRTTLDILAADYACCTSFKYENAPMLTIPFHVFGGNGDRITRSELDAWRCETTAPMCLEMFEGGHFFFKQNDEAFLAHICATLCASHVGEKCAKEFTSPG